MNILRLFAGRLILEITSADNTAILRHLSDSGVFVYDVLVQDAFSIRITIRRKDYDKTDKILRKYNGKLRVLDIKGALARLFSVIQHPVLLCGGILILVLVLVVPNRVMHVRVEGNRFLPQQLIIDKAAECGIRVGASRRIIRSEKVKNALLSAIPELQWIGVNTSGCVATISVSEKSLPADDENHDDSVSSIVASRDGVIVSATVLRGNLLCKEGDAVQTGQTLVSGYTDCGITVRATCAEAEILAQTSRRLCSMTPTFRLKRGELIETQVRYGLNIGKKLIKFYKDSGISDASCVKMYSEEYLTLPGGFALPVSIVKETLYFYETGDGYCAGAQWLQAASRKYLLQQMTAGQILNESSIMTENGDVCILNGKFACLEMIGQVKYEELMYDYGEEH